MVVFITCKNEEDPLKNAGSRMLAKFSPFKSMVVFSNAQGQLNPQFVIELSRNSNSSEVLWLSSLPAKMKKIPVNNESTRELKRLFVIFFRRSMAANSEVSRGILLKSN